MNSRNDCGPIPNRWLHCPRKSETTIDNRFIAFKTPLSSEFNNKMDMKELFLPEMMFGWCKTLKLKLGLWIDLTNTKRFYDRNVVEKNGARYFKLQCRGHGETPSREQTHSFIEIVSAFVNENPFDLVAVHCTHGFNRTGFLIASYLVECQDYSIAAALDVFAKARPPGIYKQDYIDELYRRYEEGEEPMEAPPMPDWSLEYDDTPRESLKRKYDMPSCSTSSEQPLNQSNGDIDNNDISNNDFDDIDDQATDADNSTEGKPRKKRRREQFIKNATFMAGIPGVTFVSDQAVALPLQHKVQDMCGWQSSGFPGSQPISMDMENMKNLSRMPYRVSWKADGNRYMMLINNRDEIYFFDRNHSCFQVDNLTFLKANNLNDHLKDTLIDGEMVIDKHQGVDIPRYLVYDVIKFCNNDIGSKPFFPDRLLCIKKEIIEPRTKAMMAGLINRPSEPFGVRMKDFWEIRYAAQLLGEQFAKGLSHEPDGLIFQPSLTPYQAGQCQDVLKWKPHELNSIDFRLQIITESGVGIVPKKVGLLFVGGLNHYYSKIKYTKELKDLNNKIIECSFTKTGNWEFMRERTDKTMPNSFNTAQAVFKSIVNPVTKEILLNFIEQHGYRDDHDGMPPPSSHHNHQGRHHNIQQRKEFQHSQNSMRPPAMRH